MRMLTKDTANRNTEVYEILKMKSLSCQFQSKALAYACACSIGLSAGPISLPANIPPTRFHSQWKKLIQKQTGEFSALLGSYAPILRPIGLLNRAPF
jgi:hypothetical protein